MKKSFINDSWRLFEIIAPAYVLLIVWILVVSIPSARHVIAFIFLSIFSLIWIAVLIYSIWTGRLSKITVYPNTIKWNRHFRSHTIYINDIRVEEVVPVRRHQWCLLVLDVRGIEFCLGLTNSRHIAKLLAVLQPSKFTEILKEEKKKCDDWRFNATI